MKKLAFLLMTILLAVGLAACGDDKGKTDDGDKNITGQEADGNESGNDAEDAGAGAGAEDEWPEEVINPEAVNNEYFIKVRDLLEENGYEVGELIAFDYSFFDGVMAGAIEINGEDMFPLQIFELREDDENLEHAKETGLGIAEYAGEKGEIPVLAIDHYYFFLAEGHPDQEAVYKLLKENLE